MTQTIDFGLEIKALSKREFEGHGSIFGNIDLGGDVVMPGAFQKSLAQHKRANSLPQMFWMHSPDQVPGIWKEMHEDGDGLFVKGELVDTPLGNEMHTLLTRKAVRGLSIGFRINEAEFDGDGVRQLKEIDLWEVSLVSMAMNPLAQIEAAKSRLSDAGEYVPTKIEFEDFMRHQLGCSKQVSRLITSKVYDGAGATLASQEDIRRDAENPEVADVLKRLAANTDKRWSAAFSNR